MPNRSPVPSLNNIDDWIQIIIVALIIGGSVFSAAAKWLIGYFSPKPGSIEDVSGRSLTSQKPAGRPPAPPIASPFPILDLFSESEDEDRPVAKRLVFERKIVVQRAGGELAGVPPLPPRVRRVTTQQQTRSGPGVTPAQREVSRPRQEAKKLESAKPRQREESVEEHGRRRDLELKRKDASQERRFAEFGQHEDKQSRLVDKRMGHVETHVSPKGEPAETVPSRDAPTSRASDRFAMRDWRRAIVFSELLSPPVSLRDGSDPRF